MRSAGLGAAGLVQFMVIECRVGRWFMKTCGTCACLHEDNQEVHLMQRLLVCFLWAVGSSSAPVV